MIIIGQQIVSDWLTVESGLAFGILLIQLPATAVLLSRLVNGQRSSTKIENCWSKVKEFCAHE